MGLWRLLCLLPAETPDHGHDEQPGTSYEGTANFASYRQNNCRNTTRDKVNCSSGSAQLFACFRAGTINLIVHPACELACQRQGASTVQPVNSLPRTPARTSFLDNAEDHDSGDDDPTSPKVTCIGQVRKDKPSKTPPRTTTAEIPHRKDLKSKGGEPQNSSGPSKWKHILGARGTVNPSQQQQQLRETTAEDSIEFYVDLNRFGSAAGSNSAQTTPTFGNPMKFSIPSTLAKTLTTGNSAVPRDEPAASVRAPSGASEGVLLWKRRSGACQPMALDLKRQGLQSGMIK